MAVVADLLADRAAEDADERPAILFGMEDAAEQIFARLVLALTPLRSVWIGGVLPVAVLLDDGEGAELLIAQQVHRQRLLLEEPLGRRPQSHRNRLGCRMDGRIEVRRLGRGMVPLMINTGGRSVANA